MFGWVPSLLHIHNIYVKDRPELHLPRTDRILQQYPKSYRGSWSPMKTSLRKRHAVRIRAHPSGDVVYGCAGASGFFVKHCNAIKLAINQTSPPSRGAGLLKQGTNSAAAQNHIVRGGAASAGRTHNTGPAEEVKSVRDHLTFTRVTLIDVTVLQETPCSPVVYVDIYF